MITNDYQRFLMITTMFVMSAYGTCFDGQRQPSHDWLRRGSEGLEGYNSLQLLRPQIAMLRHRRSPAIFRCHVRLLGGEQVSGFGKVLEKSLRICVRCGLQTGPEGAASWHIWASAGELARRPVLLRAPGKETSADVTTFQPTPDLQIGCVA